MVRATRTRYRREVEDAAGRPCVMVGETLAVTIGFGNGGAGASYRRPVAVERGGVVTPIVDTVMVVRLVGLLAVTLAMLIGAMRR